MSETPHITIRSDPGFPPDLSHEVVRARAWAYVFRCYEAKKNPAADQSVRGDSDETEGEEDSANVPILP